MTICLWVFGESRNPPPFFHTPTISYCTVTNPNPSLLFPLRHLPFPPASPPSNFAAAAVTAEDDIIAALLYSHCLVPCFLHAAAAANPIATYLPRRRRRGVTPPATACQSLRAANAQRDSETHPLLLFSAPSSSFF